MPSVEPIRNVLLLTLDQFRADCLSAAGHPMVHTPNLDALAAQGVRFARHYSQAAPCGPGRASLYTGMYQMNTRVVANGTPLDRRFTNIALEVRRAGYDPSTFGYTDVAFDPRFTTGPDDPRLDDYEGLLEGMTHVVDLSDDVSAWQGWLAERGYDVPERGYDAVATEPSRPAAVSLSAFTTDEILRWVGEQVGPWFAHGSYLRPHPPYAAAGSFADLYDPAAVPPPMPIARGVHGFLDVALNNPLAAAPVGPALQRVQAQYYGMISELDAQLGRLWAGLQAAGCWENTLIVVTADHADQMGDRGLIGKLGFYPESYHIPGIIRDPRSPSSAGTVVDRFTENIDLVPTMLDALGLPIPLQCDGRSLLPFLRGEQPTHWRDAAHSEFDWRDQNMDDVDGRRPDVRRLEMQNLAVLHDETGAFVHFGNGSTLCFDLATDPTWQTMQADPGVELTYAKRMLTWRANHLDRILADFVCADGGKGYWPPGVPWRDGSDR